jgi:dTDP-4-dehydrorhamnose 3,5-epimerase-like enzyme
MYMKINHIIDINPSNGKIMAYEPLIGTYDRVYFVYGAKKGTSRGHHAHKKLEQLLVCVYGSIEVTLFDGRHETVRILDNPTFSLSVGPMVWRTMRWLKDDSILFVLATEPYDETDYIRDYDIFLQTVNK